MEKKFFIVKTYKWVKDSFCYGDYSEFWKKETELILAESAEAIINHFTNGEDGWKNTTSPIGEGNNNLILASENEKLGETFGNIYRVEVYPMTYREI